MILCYLIKDLWERELEKKEKGKGDCEEREIKEAMKDELHRRVDASLEKKDKAEEDKLQATTEI